MSESTLLRRGDTGAPGNKGKFDGHHRTDADESLSDQLAAAAHAEYLADARTDALERSGIDLNDIAELRGGGAITTVVMRDTQPGGWDTAAIDALGTISYTARSVRHRTDGPAVTHRGDDPSGADDVEQVWLDGKQMPDPDNGEIGLHFIGAEGEAGSRVLTYRSYGNYEVTVMENGPTTFVYDGDIHREGGPAITHQDGHEQWFDRGAELPAPLPAEPRIEVVAEGHRGLSRVYGAKHAPETPLAEVASSIREDLANAQRLGMLPTGAKFKVSTRGRDKHIQITVEGLHPDDVLNPLRDEMGQRWFSPLGQQVSDRVKAIGQAYNRWEDGAEASPSQTDFHLGASISTS